jgi:hypothetical protein
VGLVGGLAVFVLVPIGLAVRGAVREEDEVERNRLLRWAGGAAGLGVALWLPVVIDQIWGQRNLSKIQKAVQHPTEAVSGFVHGPAELLRNLDPTALVTGRDLTGVSHASGLCIPASLLLVAWAAAVVTAWRRGLTPVLRLHVVVAAALGLAMFSSTRIYGLLWSYLFLWAWGLTILMLIATAWTLGIVARSLLPEEMHVPMARVVTAGALVLATSVAAISTVDNRDAEPARTDLSHDLGVVSGQLVRRLDGNGLRWLDRDGRLLVRWTDPVTIGSQGWGLVSELERAGYEAGFTSSYGVGGTKHRVIPEGEEAAIVQLVVGKVDIDEWASDPGAQRVAYVDSRTPAQRRRYESMVDDVEAQLREADIRMTDGKLAADEWRKNLFTTSLDEHVPEAIRVEMRKVLDITAPVALFVLHPGHAITPQVPET